MRQKTRRKGKWIKNHQDWIPLPTNAFVPERDVDKSPVLEARHIGIEFPADLQLSRIFSLIIGRTEIAGLIGRTEREDNNIQSAY